MASIMDHRAIKNLTPVKDDYPEKYISNNIEIIEQGLFLNTLSIDFYNLILSNKKKTDNINTYSTSKTYSLGDKVYYKGDIYESQKNANEDSPTSDSWERFKPFIKEGFNDLYNNGLANWIAYEVICSSMVFSTTPLGSKGLMHFSDDNSQTAPQWANQQVKNQYKHFADTHYRLMMLWISNNYEKDAYSNIDWSLIPNLTAVTEETTKKDNNYSRNIAWGDE